MVLVLVEVEVVAEVDVEEETLHHHHHHLLWMILLLLVWYRRVDMVQRVLHILVDHDLQMVVAVLLLSIYHLPVFQMALDTSFHQVVVLVG